MNKTTFVNKETLIRKWQKFDATDQVLGRLATSIASALSGKTRADYTAHTDMGNKIVVTNAAKIKVTGKKETDKLYYRHTGYPGGIKAETYKEKMAKDPTDVIRVAVEGMLPKNKLRKVRMSNLYIYKDETHPHEANLK
jgi:large subunit ribosomal protein L13